MFNKYLFSAIFLMLGLTSIHFLKNETRELEIKISEKRKSILNLKEDLEIAKVEFAYLSSPERITKLAKIYLPKDYISLFPNQLIINEKK